MRQKVFRGGRVWGVGCGVWGFIHFQGVNYLIFREKVPKFPPRSPQGLALFDGKKV
ncbi:Type IV pilin PilA [Microcystis aeruginosa NIES-98]|nr:Type IV pilin PilA [Microcystis aeruginosa NIES-98]